MMRRPIRVLIGVSLLWLSGCRGLFLSEGGGTATAPDSVPRLSFALRAESGRCDLATVPVRRQGRAVLVVLSVQSVGRQHTLLIPDLHIRRTVGEGKEETIQFVADRSGIYEFGCTTFSSLGPFAWRGKITVD